MSTRYLEFSRHQKKKKKRLLISSTYISYGYINSRSRYLISGRWHACTSSRGSFIRCELHSGLVHTLATVMWHVWMAYHNLRNPEGTVFLVLFCIYLPCITTKKMDHGLYKKSGGVPYRSFTWVWLKMCADYYDYEECGGCVRLVTQSSGPNILGHKRRSGGQN